MTKRPAPLVRFSASRETFTRARRAFDALREDLSRLLPAADIQHVGGTAIRGARTKGDLDVQVRVPAREFRAAKAALSRRLRKNLGAFRSRTSASFKDDAADPPLGLHLTVIGCADDFQWRQRNALLARADLRREYDRLKRRFDGRPIAAYRKAKEAFFERLARVGAAGRRDRGGATCRSASGARSRCWSGRTRPCRG